MKKSKEILIQRIKNGIAKPFNDELIKLIKPAIRIIPNERQLNSNTFSKFGGIPLVEENNKWLRQSSSNNPYAFLLQLDLEEIKPFDIENQLPKKGLISVWFNLDSWDDGKIIYHKDKTKLVEAILPIEYQEEESRKKLPIWKKIFTKSNGLKLFPERHLFFEKEYHSPSWDSLQIELFHLENNTKPRDIEIDEKYIDDYREEYHSDHHLLGYYGGLQPSIYELMDITKGKYFDKLTRELIKKGLEWKLLLQIDSDKITNMQWADGGKILFFIKEDDLQKENFNNLLVQLDST